MVDITGEQINSVIQHVRTLHPGMSGRDGDIQLSIIALALCVAARSVGVDKETLLYHLGNHFDDASTRDLIELPPPEPESGA